jgi:hypothetical protein
MLKSFIVLVLSAFLFAACDGSSVVEPVKTTKSTRGARVIAPSSISGWWKFQGYVIPGYPYPVAGNYGATHNGCSTSNRWMYISPTNYNVYFYNGNGCSPGSLADILSVNYEMVEYFIWSTFSGENTHYAYDPAGYFDVYRGNNSVVYSAITIFNSGNNMQLQVSGSGYYYARTTDTPPSLP